MYFEFLFELFQDSGIFFLSGGGTAFSAEYQKMSKWRGKWMKGLFCTGPSKSIRAQNSPPYIS